MTTRLQQTYTHTHTHTDKEMGGRDTYWLEEHLKWETCVYVKILSHHMIGA